MRGPHQPQSLHSDTPELTRGLEIVGISNILLTVLGFVVGLGLSFRSSTAYERYAEGRRYWAQLILASQNLGRVFWVHSSERKNVPEDRKEENRKRELLEKLSVTVLFLLAPPLGYR